MSDCPKIEEYYWMPVSSTDATGKHVTSSNLTDAANCNDTNQLPTFHHSYAYHEDVNVIKDMSVCPYPKDEGCCPSKRRRTDIEGPGMCVYTDSLTQYVCTVYQPGETEDDTGVCIEDSENDNSRVCIIRC